MSGSHPLLQIVKNGLSYTVEGRANGRLHAKEAGFCARSAAVSSMKSGIDVVGASSTLYMAVGIAVHDAVKDALKRQGVLLYEELKTPDIGLNVGGYADAIINLNGEMLGVEVKTCGSLPKVIKSDHFAQATLYSAILGIPFAVLYISRNVANFYGETQISVISCNSTEADHLKVVYSTAYAHLCTKLGVMPMKPNFESEKDCGFCGLKPICWHGEDGEFPQIDPTTNARVTKEAVRLTKHILSKEEVDKRRAMVIETMKTTGTDDAKTFFADKEKLPD